MSELERFEKSYGALRKKLEDARGQDRIVLNEAERSLAWGAVAKAHLELQQRLRAQASKFPQEPAKVEEPGVILTDVLPHIQH